MIVRMGILTRKPDLSHAQFRAHWLGQHAALARRLPGLRAYRQNHVTDSRQLGIAHRRGPWQFDGFSQLWFESDARMKDGIASEVGPKLEEDEARFIGDLHIIAAEAFTVIEPPATPGAALKRMSLLTKAEGMSDTRFRHEWLEVHAERVKQMEGVRGYRQNVIVHREREKGTPCGRDAFPIDGIVELWFDDVPSIEAAFGSEAGQAAMAHAGTFLSEITTFLVEEHVIV